MNKICAGIVIYNPNLEKFQSIIDRVVSQFDKVYLYCNSEFLFSNFDYGNADICILGNNKNEGIAKALNKITNQADIDGYDWIVTLDQDSIIPLNLREEYEKFLNHKNVGIICPQVIDKRRKYMELKCDKNIEWVDFCITSASCTNIDIWKKIGGFDEYLFIDLVDNDFCKRLTLLNYKILQLNYLVLDQEFGTIIPKSDRIVNFYLYLSKLLNNTNIAKLSYKKKVSPLRIYYTNRNILYLNKKYIHFGGIGYRNYNVKTYFGFILCFSLPSILRAQNKVKVIKAVITGINDGIKSPNREFKIKNNDQSLM